MLEPKRQKEKLQVLWWLASGQVSQHQELGRRLGRDSSTISRWLQKYRQGGLSALLEEKPLGGKQWEIEGEMTSATSGAVARARRVH